MKNDLFYCGKLLLKSWHFFFYNVVYIAKRVQFLIPVSHFNGIYMCYFVLSRLWSVVSSVQFDFTPCVPSSFKLFNAKQKAIMQALVVDILN